ncbi:unnamed protein product [Toxocara canis]|uniref:Trafficking protein particle complex subunit n=1 Tax=Toxocara canis TaxID=6265 RepID=A0A183VDF5_TOXCA|nr:unnamed protein product [Toxocara canis]
MSINGSLLDGALVVGILHGILFMCETKGFEALDQIYNFAVTYVEINPNFGKSQQSDEVKVFLLSQHFKEFFVVVANIAGLYYKAFKTLTDRCRAYTLDLRDFETIPKLTLYSEKNILTTIDVFENVLYLYYGVKSATYTVPLGGTNAMQPEMLEVPLPPMNTDTFSGKRFFHFGTQVQVFNEKSLLLIRTVQRFSRSKFDALLVLKRTEQVTAPSMGFYFGIKDCLLFVVRFLTQLDSLPQSKGAHPTLLYRIPYQQFFL